MKKCPTCDKTFEDSMKFCQVDGTQLIDDEPAFDPYATIVARPNIPEVKQEPTAEETPADEPPSPDPEPEPAAVEDSANDAPIHLTVGSVPIAPPEDILDLPNADPLKTMFVSEDEIRGAFEPADEAKEEEPVAEQPPMPEPPAFITPETSSPSVTEPPPSPFSDSGNVHEEAAIEPEPQKVEFDEAATMIQSTPFATPEPPAPVEAWTPPPAPDANWQDQQIGQNTPFQPPPAGAGGENKTLAIVSLVFGIISLCCYVSPLTGLVALITGFLAMKNVNNDPVQYGGKGLAIAGMVTGGLFFLIGIIYWVFLLFFGGFAMMMDAAR